MYFVDNNTGVPVMPPVKEVLSSSPLFFTEGGNGVPPTWPGPDWFNIIQSELINFLAAYGVNPEKSNLNQLQAAVEEAIHQKATESSALLTAIAALVTSANQMPYFTGEDEVAMTALTDFAREILAQTNPDGVLSKLGLGGGVRESAFTASSTWTCPANVTQISVDACGGGGGGAGGASGGTGGGGGGGAAAVIGRKVTVVPGTVYTVTIGTGGAGGTTNSAPGGTGGTTSLGVLLSLSGGVGGTRVTTGGGGAAGGEGGLPGYDGYYSSNPSVSVAGAGGGCLLGAGGAGGATSQIGCKPGQFGGGGGGGAGQAITGGDGASGFMRITW